MSYVLRQSTAVDVLIGPFSDSTDGDTAETALTIAQADVRLSKNGQNMAQKNDATSCVHDELGFYNCELDATDTNTVGELDLVVHESGALVVRERFQVMDTEAYDALYADGANILTSLDIGQLYESAITTVTGQQEHIMTASLVTNDVWIGQVVIVEDVSTGESWVTWISDMVASTDTLHLGEAPPFTVVAGDILRVESRRHSRYDINAYDPPTRAEAASDQATILAKLLAYFRLMTRSDGFVDIDDSTELTAINGDGGSGAGDYDPEVDSQEAIADTALAIKVPTDKLTFTVANEVDANTKSMNDANIVGDGTAGDKWRDV